MNKAYSNKALPSGTILREWQLEEVLGVGGFGIVYKGRGIYFNELVAIKEYFPSSISERDAEDTVVPIDSDAEEVHALGLKKFVEEAKLLWNLSTPTRHPNIVSVRSLFEIHGTAYMVMDFEDGLSLSKMLKQGRRFNERSLWSLIRPIAEGLDRAHRVGVLHRDIKPPNILINEDNRPVLIDFGSARFEAAEATSTKVTFHTPPYAAMEQYVKTYDQGPWTDVYALGVVLYECITGEKPPEVLERLHGGQGTPLAEGKWPGYSQRFLAAVDAAMTIRPAERPQSITEWLALFGTPSKGADANDDDEATRFALYDPTAEEIVPVAPLAPGFTPREPVESRVPADPSEVQFKRVGQDTSATKKRKAVPSPTAKSTEDKAVPAAAAAAASAKDEPAKPKKKLVEAEKPADDKKAAAWAWPSKVPPRIAAGAGAAVLLTAAALGWAIFGGDGDDIAAADMVAQEQGPIEFQPIAAGDFAAYATAAQTIAGEAGEAGAPAEAVERLTQASQDLANRASAIEALGVNNANAGAAAAGAEELRRAATAADVEFATALVRDAEAKAQRLSADLPWTRANSGSREPASRQRAAENLRSALASLRSAVETGAAAPDPTQPFKSARLALAEWQRFGAASSAAYALRSVAEPTAVETRQAAAPAVERRAPQPTASKSRTSTRTETAATGVSAAKMRQFNAIIDDGRDMAKRVIRMGRDRGGSSAEDRRNYQTRQANVKLARNYESYLNNLKDSMRGVNSDREADRLIAQANQTKAYLQFLVRQSSEAQ